MKCDYFIGRKFDGEVYILASDVTEAIAELKQKLENVQASMYADVVDANMENRRLKRALWLARAESADGQYLYWITRFGFGVESGYTKADILGYSLKTKRRLRTIAEWFKMWKNVERKCRAKAEEYK